MNSFVPQLDDGSEITRQHNETKNFRFNLMTSLDRVYNEVSNLTNSNKNDTLELIKALGHISGQITTITDGIEFLITTKQNTTNAAVIPELSHKINNVHHELKDFHTNVTSLLEKIALSNR